MKLLETELSNEASQIKLLEHSLHPAPSAPPTLPSLQQGVRKVPWQLLEAVEGSFTNEADKKSACKTNTHTHTYTHTHTHTHTHAHTNTRTYAHLYYTYCGYKSNDEKISRIMRLLSKSTQTHIRTHVCAHAHMYTRTVAKRSVERCSCSLETRPHSVKAMTKRLLEACSCLPGTRTHTHTPTH